MSRSPDAGPIGPGFEKKFLPYSPIPIYRFPAALRAEGFFSDRIVPYITSNENPKLRERIAEDLKVRHGRLEKVVTVIGAGIPQFWLKHGAETCLELDLNFVQINNFARQVMKSKKLLLGHLEGKYKILQLDITKTPADTLSAILAGAQVIYLSNIFDHTPEDEAAAALTEILAHAPAGAALVLGTAHPDSLAPLAVKLEHPNLKITTYREPSPDFHINDFLVIEHCRPTR